MVENGTNRIDGRIVRINGPIVEAEGMHAAGMLEVVEVGDLRLIGEIIRLKDDLATIQVYENTGGLKPGQPVVATGRPLSVALGPGLLGSIYDGIQRPLPSIMKHSGIYIRRGEKTLPLDAERKWPFVPLVKVGDALKPGQIYAEVQETLSIKLRLPVPPDAEGRVAEIAPAGEYANSAVVLKLEATGGTVREFTMIQMWPARKPRPALGRVPMTMPMVTGLRVIDTFFPDCSGRYGGDSRRVRDGEDNDAARAGEVGRGGRDRVHRLRRTWQRDDGSAENVSRTGGSAHGALDDGAYGDDCEHLEHAGGGA